MSEELKPFQRVLVRDDENQEWRASFFSNEYRHGGKKAYVCTGFTWAFCIPYEGNEHLLGTTDSPTPPEPEFKWGDHVEVRDCVGLWSRAVFLRRRGPNYEVIHDGETLSRLYSFCRHADW